MKPTPPAKAVTLQARLYRVAMIRWVDVPQKALAGLALLPAENTGLHALLYFNDDVDRVTLLPGKSGHYKLAFKVELLAAARRDAGDTVTFSLATDAGSREPALPDEMARVFREQPALARKWESHSIANRRQVVRYIEQAKSPAVRAKRCWIFLDRLADTGQLSAT